MNGLLEKYNDYIRLVGSHAEYELSDGTTIDVQYVKGGFAHLVGLHKLKDLQLIQLWQDTNVKAVNVSEVMRRIRNESFGEKEVKNSMFFHRIKDRYDSFSYDNLTTLNYTDAIVDFNPRLINSKLKSNYILFEEKRSGDFNHMGIVYKPNLGSRYVETFFHDSSDTYIKGQTIVQVRKFRLIDSNNNVIVEDEF